MYMLTCILYTVSAMEMGGQLWLDTVHVFIYFDMFYILWPVDQGDLWSLK
jgi:hypothetical protein